MPPFTSSNRPGQINPHISPEWQCTLQCLEDEAGILRATTLIRSLAPRTMIVARARDLAASKALLRAGANKAFPEAVEASLTLAAEALISIGVTAKDTGLFLRRVRNSDYALVRDAAEVA